MKLSISYTIKLHDRDEIQSNDEQITPLQIIEKIRNKEFPKYTITYIDSKIVEKENHIILNANNDIDANVKGGGIYFILSAEGDRLLYVGKSKSLKTRLGQHLCKCPEKTYSHIFDVQKYLERREKNNKALEINYCVINTEKNNHNATIEGAIIDYILCQQDNDFLSECWNKRAD